MSMLAMSDAKIYSVGIMKSLLCIAAGAFSLCFCLIFVDPVLAKNTTTWFKNDIETSNQLLPNSGQRGQCRGTNVSIDEGGGKGSMLKCIIDTEWGSISSDGFVRIDGFSATFYKLAVPENGKLLSAPHSEMLYFSVPVSSTHFRVAYITNPKISLNFNPFIFKYELPHFFSYIPGTFSTVGFSNNSSWMIGKDNNGSLKRIQLSNFSTSTVDPVSFVSSFNPKHLAISNDGTLVFSLNQAIGQMYDFENCRQTNGTWCSVREVADNLDETLPQGVESIYIEDESEAIAILSPSIVGNVTRLYIHPYNETRYVDYMALGDSFSSGEGVWTYTEGTDGNDVYPNEKCHTSSSESYAARYAERYQAVFDRSAGGNSGNGMRISSLLMLACSGAETVHIWRDSLQDQNSYTGQFGQYVDAASGVRQQIKNYALENQIPGRVLQRDFLAHYQPAVATIGIGGNDAGFGATMMACFATNAACPQVAQLRDISGKNIQKQFSKLVNTYKDLHNASPNTRLYAVGYPLFIADDSLFCGINSSLSKAERTFFKESIKYLNRVIKAAAKKAGIGYIDIESSLGNGALCGKGQDAVNGLALGNDVAIAGLSMIAQESFHPNGYGYSLIGNNIVYNYGELDSYPNLNCPTVASGYCPNNAVKAPSVPVYFGEKLDEKDMVIEQSNLLITVIRSFVRIQLVGLKSFSKLNGSIFSEPRSLGEFTVGPDGTFNQAVTFPDDLEPGYHTLYFSGIAENGEPYTYTQVILYAPPAANYGPCGLFPYSNIDQDRDGIDDACDPAIDVENEILLEDPSTLLIDPNPRAVLDAEKQKENEDSRANQLVEKVAQTLGLDRVTILESDEVVAIEMTKTNDEIGIEKSEKSASNEAAEDSKVPPQSHWIFFGNIILGIILAICIIYGVYKVRTR